MTTATKITCYPTNWPSDNRSRVTRYGGEIIIVHPDRTPHLYDEKTKKWKEITPNVQEQKTASV